MNVRPRTILSFAVLSLSVLAAVATDVGIARRAQAQLKEGEFGLVQSSTLVGWAYASTDHTREYWAYLEGTYDWADASNTASHPWTLQAQFIGSGPWASFDAWKADVLRRPEAQGKTVRFQNHSVVEEQVNN